MELRKLIKKIQKVYESFTKPTPKRAQFELCSCSYNLEPSLQNVPMSHYGFIEGKQRCSYCSKKKAIIVDRYINVAMCSLSVPENQERIDSVQPKAESVPENQERIDSVQPQAESVAEHQTAKIEEIEAIDERELD